MGFTNLSGSFPFGIFKMSFSDQILVEQGKIQVLLEKQYHFSEKISNVIKTLLI
jgi:hypothetical protein